jgi:hypothetical protein
VPSASISGKSLHNASSSQSSSWSKAFSIVAAYHCAKGSLGSGAWSALHPSSPHDDRAAWMPASTHASSPAQSCLLPQAVLAESPAVRSRSFPSSRIMASPTCKGRVPGSLSVATPRLAFNAHIAARGGDSLESHSNQMPNSRFRLPYAVPK